MGLRDGAEDLFARTRSFSSQLYHRSQTSCGVSRPWRGVAGIIPRVGTAIHGFVECRTWELGRENGDTAWYSAVSLSMLGMTRDCGACDCLFGVPESGRWRPVAPARGIPRDAAELTRNDFESLGEAAFGATFLGWREAAAIDWDEPALLAADIVQYRRRPDQGLELVHRSVWDHGFAAVSGIDTAAVSPDRVPELFAEGTEWTAGDTVFRVERARRREVVPPDGAWEAVWTVMRALARMHGDDGVRLVTWFEG